MTNFDYDAHIKNEQIKANLTPEQLQELKDLYVERLVDNMSTKDLVRYVFDDMTDYVNSQSPVEFFDDAYSYFDDYFDELVEEIKGGQSENDLNQEQTMNFTKDQLLALMNTIDFATDNDASYEEYTILSDGSSDLEPIRDILYNEYITKGENS